MSTQPLRIHVMGAPGAGVSSLGLGLASALGCTHFDADDFYWYTDDPLPYKRKRNPDHRRQLLSDALASNARWVLSGSMSGWGDSFAPMYHGVIFLWEPASVRLERIRQREANRYGAALIDPGGPLHTVFEKFCAWAAEYDFDTQRPRSLAKEKAWAEQLACPVLWLMRGSYTPVEVLQESLAFVRQQSL